MIKIAITGAHSVGKTTLFNYLVEHYSRNYKVEKISEVARKMIRQGFRMSKDITDYGIATYAHEYLSSERNANGDILISDRCLIDLFAYITCNNSVKVKSNYVKLIKEIVYLAKDSYDIYFYIPIEIPFEFDGIRPEDENYRHNVGSTILNILKTMNVNYVEITGSILERQKKAKAYIDSMLKSHKYS
jgi:nicotinamide riboside kinase